MTYLSIFAGCGGLDRAMPGQAVAHVEWDAYAQRVLRRHWPDVPVLGDVRTVNGADFRGVDWVIGGPPCQAASHAGLQLGEADPRWMWPEAIRVLRECEAPGAFFENVPGLVTLNAGRSFGAILSALTALGYFVRWDHCTAAEVGRPHLRDRVWIVGTRTPGPMGWMSVPIAQVRKWPRAGWAWEGRTREDVARWPKREVWPLVCPDVCPPSGMWPTPSGGCFNDAEDIGEWEARRARVKEAAGNGNGFGMPLGVASRLWPTARTSDGNGAREPDSKRGISLTEGTRLWPTPRSEDSESSGLRVDRGVADTLTATTRLWPTPDANAWKGSTTPEQRRGQLTAFTEPGNEGRLNPQFVEWLMGWPLDYTLPEGPSLAHAPPPPRAEEIAPRLTDVKEHRRNRLRLTGNGVCTETAALVWRTLGKKE